MSDDNRTVATLERNGSNTTSHADLARMLEQRITGSVDAGTLELEVFIRLIGIEITTDVPSAAVTTGARSRMRINPEFVQKHCQRDEHLVLLVLHEIWHILLGHTRMFPRVSPAQNIACDAIINAGLSRQFTEPAYRGFFEGLYDAQSFPQRLLRPPEGWPHSPSYRGPGPRRTESILRRLYPPSGEPPTAEPAWTEIVNLLGALDRVDPVLLGDHGPESTLRSPFDDPLLGPVVRSVTEGWPSPASFLGVPGLASSPTQRTIDRASLSDSIAATIEQVVRRAARPHRHGGRAPGSGTAMESVRSVIPCGVDRRRVAQERLGVHPLLRASRTPTRRPSDDGSRSTRMYLDVSLSMADVLPHLFGPLEEFSRRRLLTLWQFSNGVEPLSLEDLRERRILTTGGTDLDEVLTHALDDERVTDVVIVTDGCVRPLNPGLHRAIRSRGLRVEIVLPHGAPDMMVSAIGRVTYLPPAKRVGP